MFIKPVFYDKFVCKAENCSDTCCAGWEIDIDSEALQKYENVTGEFAARLHDGIADTDGQPCFLLKADDRCVFLSDNGLCDIYSNLGKEFLCEICKEHPRFYDVYDSITEAGLGLCCERVCEMLLDSNTQLTFDYDFNFEDVDDDIATLLKIRELCFEIINNKSITFSERIRNLIRFADASQYEYFCVESNDFSFSDKKSLIMFVLTEYAKTEPINNKWTVYIERLIADLSDILASAEDYIPDFDAYEKILSYIIYRHFMHSRFDGRITDVIRMGVAALSFVYICECDVYSKKHCVDVDDRVNIIKLWSQQMEYSEENVEHCLTMSEECV